MSVNQPAAPVPHTPGPLDLGLVAAAFLRSVPIALAVGVVAGGAIGGVLTQLDPVYEVTTDVGLGAVSNPDLNPESVAQLVPLYLSIAEDTETAAAVEQATGVRDPEISATDTSVAGVIQVSTTGSSTEQARQLADAAVAALQERSGRLHADSVSTLTEQAADQTTALREQIEQRRAADRDADVSDLEWQIELINQDLNEQLPESMLPVQLSRSGGEDPVWPRPLATGVVVGLIAFLVAAIPLTWWRMRRHHRADRFWLRGVAHRFGVPREFGAADRGLTPLAESRAAAVLAAGDEVLLLGRVDPGEAFAAYAPERIHQAGWRDHWWRDLDPTRIGLGVVVIDHRDNRADQAATAVQRLVDSGIPAYVVVRSGKRNEE